jgi:hypothetical protein
MGGLFDCRTCRDTGVVFDVDDAAPYAPTPRYQRQGRYCLCSCGDALRAKEAREVADLRAQNDAARAWADEHMTAPEEACA